MTATTDETALLAAIRANPAEDTVRLVYADWLDENGQPGPACNQRLAVLLRAIKAAPDDDAPRLQYAAVCELYGRKERAELIRVQCELARGGSFDDLLRLYARERELLPLQPLNKCGLDMGDFVFERGFVGEVQCHAADWLEHGDSIDAQNPVTAVVLTRLPSLEIKAHEIPGKTVSARLPGRNWHGVPNMSPEDIIRAILRADWPHITFTLPT